MMLELKTGTFSTLCKPHLREYSKLMIEYWPCKKSQPSPLKSFNFHCSFRKEGAGKKSISRSFHVITCFVSKQLVLCHRLGPVVVDGVPEHGHVEGAVVMGGIENKQVDWLIVCFHFHVVPKCLAAVRQEETWEVLVVLTLSLKIYL